MLIKHRRILLSLHLQGKMGNCGRMTYRERIDTLQYLMDNGYITNKCELTAKAHREIHESDVICLN